MIRPENRRRILSDLNCSNAIVNISCAIDWIEGNSSLCRYMASAEVDPTDLPGHSLGHSSGRIVHELKRALASVERAQKNMQDYEKDIERLKKELIDD